LKGHVYECSSSGTHPLTTLHYILLCGSGNVVTHCLSVFLFLATATTGIVAGTDLGSFPDGLRRVILQEEENISCKFSSAEFCFCDDWAFVTGSPFLPALSFLLGEILFIGNEDSCRMLPRDIHVVDHRLESYYCVVDHGMKSYYCAVLCEIVHYYCASAHKLESSGSSLHCYVVMMMHVLISCQECFNYVHKWYSLPNIVRMIKLGFEEHLS